MLDDNCCWLGDALEWLCCNAVMVNGERNEKNGINGKIVDAVMVKWSVVHYAMV